MLKRLTLALLGLALLSAGCLDASTDGNDELQQTDTSAQDESADQADRGSPNTAPVASLEANQTSGEAPLSVSFTLAGSDEDGDPLNWTFTIDQGSHVSTGKELPTTVKHTYTRAGNYSAVLAVDDGTDTDEATVVITVTAADADEDGTNETDENATSPAGPEPVVIRGNATVGHPAHVLHCFRAGIDGQYHEITPAGGGWTYALEPADAFAVYWWGDAFIESGEDNGTVPSGATHAEVCMTEGNVMMSYTLTLWQPGHPEAPGA